jgi:hypothetical protein
MSSEQHGTEVERRLREADLLPFVDWPRSQVIDLGEQTYVEVVLKDAAKEEEVRHALGAPAPHVDIQIHPVWVVEEVGEPQPAISKSGGYLAARLVPVMLRSGSTQSLVQVLITYLAEIELKRMLNGEPDLQRLAREYVQEHLKWGGESYWDPRRYDRLEIGADRALILYRALLKTA